MTTKLYRPVGPQELALIKDLQWKAFPPRLPEQPIFYPVTNEEYAIQIAREWNVKSSGSGYVTQFDIDASYAAKFPRKVVGNKVQEELWVPAEELAMFNSKIVGEITVIHSFQTPEDHIAAFPTEGIWQPVYAELDGEEAPRMALEKMELELKEGRYTVRFGGEAYDHGTYKAEGTALTLHGLKGSNAGRTIPALFKFAGEMLSICYGLNGTRPAKFATGPGQQRYLVNYLRKQT